MYFLVECNDSWGRCKLDTIGSGSFSKRFYQTYLLSKSRFQNIGTLRQQLPLYLLFLLIILTTLSLNGKELENVKSFLSNPPAIREFSAIYTQYDGGFSNRTYCFLRYQDGNYVMLQSKTNQLILQGKVDQSDIHPMGIGKFEDSYWFFWGNLHFINVYRWKGPLSNAPPEITNRLKEWCRGPVWELLTLGTQIMPPGTCKWDGEWTSISIPHEDTDLEARLEQGANGQVSRMRYMLRTNNSKRERKLTNEHWCMDYEYGNPDVPPCIPSKITRSYITSKSCKIYAQIEIVKLTLSNPPLVGGDFDPELFLSSNVTHSPSKFVDKNISTIHREGINTFKYITIAVLVLAVSPLALTFLLTNRK